MVIKEKKLAILIYLLRYGRMTREECASCLMLHGSNINRNWIKLLEIPGVYTNKDSSILYSFYYILSHRISSFQDHTGKVLLLKDVKNKSPFLSTINCSSNTSLRESFT